MINSVAWVLVLLFTAVTVDSAGLWSGVFTGKYSENKKGWTFSGNFMQLCGLFVWISEVKDVQNEGLRRLQ